MFGKGILCAYRPAVIAIAGIPLFSGIDAAATLYWIQMGYATEANPLMAVIINFSHVGFMLWKTNGVATLIVLILLGLRMNNVGEWMKKSIEPMLMILFLVYAVVIIKYHIGFALGL